MSAPQLAWALGGGGEKGAFQAGACLALAEAGQDPDLIAGISVGSINAAVLGAAPRGADALAEQARRCCDLWRRTRTSDVRSGSVLSAVLTGRSSVYSSEPLRRMIAREVDLPALRASGRRVSVGAVCWEDDLDYRTWDQHSDDFPEAVRASAAFQVLLPPVEIGGRLYGDGGARNVVPVGDCVRAGASEVVAVACGDAFAHSRWKAGGWFPRWISRALDMVTREVERGDYQAVGDRNELADLAPGYRRVKLTIVKPPIPLEAPEPLGFDPQLAADWIELGHATARAALSKARADEVRR